MKYSFVLNCPLLFFVLYKIPVEHGGRHFDGRMVSPEMFLWLHLINHVTIALRGIANFKELGHAVLVKDIFICITFSETSSKFMRVPTHRPKMGTYFV